jgi:hypothetical protein
MTISSALAASIIYALGFVSGAVITVGALMIWIVSSDFGKITSRKPHTEASRNQ